MSILLVLLLLPLPLERFSKECALAFFSNGLGTGVLLLAPAAAGASEVAVATDDTLLILRRAELVRGKLTADLGGLSERACCGGLDGVSVLLSMAAIPATAEVVAEEEVSTVSELAAPVGLTGLLLPLEPVAAAATASVLSLAVSNAAKDVSTLAGSGDVFVTTAAAVAMPVDGLP